MTQEPMPQTDLAQKALAAMRNAVAKVIEEHRRNNLPLAIWRDGKVVWISPYDLSIVKEDSFQYNVKPSGSD